MFGFFFFFFAFVVAPSTYILTRKGTAPAPVSTRCATAERKPACKSFGVPNCRGSAPVQESTCFWLLLPGELSDGNSRSACAGQNTARKRDRSSNADVKMPKVKDGGSVLPREQTCWSSSVSKLSTCQGRGIRIARPQGR